MIYILGDYMCIVKQMTIYLIKFVPLNNNFLDFWLVPSAMDLSHYPYVDQIW